MSVLEGTHMQRIDSPGNGVIERWLVNEGEPVPPGAALFILTQNLAAATIRAGTSTELVLLKIAVPAGRSVTAGTKLALLGQAEESVTPAQLESIALYPPVPLRVSVWVTYLRLLRHLALAVLIEAVIVASIALYHRLKEGAIPPASALLSQSRPFLLLLVVLYLVVNLLVVPAVNRRRPR